MSTPRRPHSLSMTVLMTPDMANFSGNVHGGHLLKIRDHVAYTCATRYAGTYVVTLSVDRVLFRGPIHVGELVTFSAAVNYTGRTSMEVGIHSRHRGHHNSSHTPHQQLLLHHGRRRLKWNTHRDLAYRTHHRYRPEAVRQRATAAPRPASHIQQPAQRSPGWHVIPDSPHLSITVRVDRVTEQRVPHGYRRQPRQAMLGRRRLHPAMVIARRPRVKAPDRSGGQEPRACGDERPASPLGTPSRGPKALTPTAYVALAATAAGGAPGHHDVDLEVAARNEFLCVSLCRHRQGCVYVLQIL